MEYPVLIGGEPAGTLREEAEGLYRVFTADCEPREGLVRLWLHGGGRSLYLGLLCPEAGRLRLTKRLSRSERAALPDRLDGASDREAAFQAREAEPGAPLWQPAAGGSLVSRRGGQLLVALPARLPPGSPAAAHLLRIGGKDYLVFRRNLAYNESEI